MRSLKLSLVALLLVLCGCSSAPASPSPVEQAAAQTASPTPATPTPSPTATAAPTPSPTPLPSPTPTQTAPLALTVVEWAAYPYANPADPANTDTHVEALVRNHNGFPVRVNLTGAELRFLNAAGEVVYTNPNPVFHLWEGSWMMAGETAPLSACACFETSGLEKQAWESLELVAPLEAAEDVAYTTDVEVTVGAFFSLEEAHLGGDALGAEISLVNTSDQTLQTFEVRVTARDASGAYVGVAIAGSFGDRDSSGGYAAIQPGASASGVIVSEIDYVDGPLEYAVAAIGIPAK